MERKTMDTLRTMICGELDDIAKEGKLSHETLDILKDLLDSAKNLEKIEYYQKEKEESEMGMDRGYSQRKYYIDADYQPGINSYMRGGRGGQGGPYGYSMDRGYDGGRMGRNSYMDDGNSYMYHPGYDLPMYERNGYNRGYSRTGKQEVIEELQELMNKTQDVKVKESIQKTIAEMNK